MTMFKKYILSIVLILSYLYSNAAASQKDNLSIKIAISEYPPYSSEHLKDFGIDNHQLNKDENNRFIKYGFDKKLKEAQSARLYGKIFYFGIIILITVIIKNYY